MFLSHKPRFKTLTIALIFFFAADQLMAYGIELILSIGR